MAISTAKLAQAVIVYNNYKASRRDHLGVTYVSKGADYAEWLPKANVSDEFKPGDIVGVKGGFISRNTTEAEKIMVISSKPIVLGNSPATGMESRPTPPTRPHAANWTAQGPGGAAFGGAVSR